MLETCLLLTVRKLKTRIAIMWGCIVALVSFPLFAIAFGPLIALLFAMVALAICLWVWVTTRCPKCGCILLGRFSEDPWGQPMKIPMYTMPVKVPRKCPCCGVDFSG